MQTVIKSMVIRLFPTKEQEQMIVWLRNRPRLQCCNQPDELSSTKFHLNGLWLRGVVTPLESVERYTNSGSYGEGGR